MSEGNQLGALLVAGGLLTREALDAALAEQTQSGKSLGRILIDNGLVTEADLVSTLAAQIGLDYVDLEEEQIDPGAIGLISPALARRYQALPIRWEPSVSGAGQGRLGVAMAAPSTSSPSMTSAPSPGPTSGRSSPPGRASPPPSTSTTGSTPT